VSTPKAPTLAMLPWFPRDYLAATRGMTLAERGAYTDLLFYSWDMGSLPNDPKRLARMLGVDMQEFMVIWPAVQPKFVRNETNGIVNERLERERRNSIGLRTKASEKAQQAARARWGSDAPSNAPSNANGNAPSINSAADSPKTMLQAMLEQCPPSPSPSPSPSAASSPANQEGERGNHSKPVNGNGSSEEPKAIRIAKATTLMKASPDLPISQIAKMYKLTEKEVRQLSKSH
jgi:uncharacterized protein YdaU (DUF1376 family)